MFITWGCHRFLCPRYFIDIAFAVHARKTRPEQQTGCMMCDVECAIDFKNCYIIIYVLIKMILE